MSEVAGYRVGRSLGRGAVATVFEVDGDRGLAIKLLNAERSARAPLSAERFLREARAASRLDHPNIVRVVDHGTDDEGVPYLVMEQVAGETLAARLEREPLPVEDALRIAAQLAGALAHAHENGVIHRDLKPANVLLEPDPLEARLVDFGLARDRHDLPLTTTGALCGTPAYMAPELVDGVPASSASDVYALGCLLFEMLAGRPPFVGTLPEVFRGHAYDEAPLVSSLRAEASAADELVRACLAKDAAGRPSCDDLVERCASAADPIASWTRRLDALTAAAEARFDALPEEVARTLERARAALARLGDAPDTAAEGHHTVVQPGRAHALAQLELHAAQLERALAD